MKEKRKFIYTLLLIFVIFFAWSYFFYFPLQTGIKITGSEIDILHSKISAIRNMSKNIEEIRKQHNKLVNDIANLEKKIIDQKLIKNLVILLEKEMQKYQMTIFAVSPIMESLTGDKSGEESFNYKYLPVDLKMESRFLDLARFLNDLSRLSVILVPEGISMMPINENSDILSIDFKAKILIKTGDNHDNI